MARGINAFDFSSFYCPKCGDKIMDLPRQKSKAKEKFHRKKLYCPHCKAVFNSVECKNDFEVYEFTEDFLNGVYENDCQEYVEVIR
jgi:ribosomal protein S27AE